MINVARFFQQSSAFRAALYRSLGVLLSSFSSFYAIRVVFEVAVGFESTLLLAISLAFFLNLFTFGVGRPLYADVKRKYMIEGLVKLDLDLPVFIALILPVVGVLGFVAILLCYLVFSNSVEFLAEVLLFSGGIGLFYTGLFQRDLFYSLDCEEIFEKYEILRKGSFLIGLLVLAKTGSFHLFFAIALIGSVIFYYAPIAQLKALTIKKIRFSSKKLVEYFCKLFLKGRFYFCFMGVELMMYNLPLLFFVARDNSAGIIVFSIWMRIFQVAVLPSRIAIDAMVNHNVKQYMQAQIKQSWLSLMKTAGLGVSMSFFSLVVLWVFRFEIFNWLSLGEVGETWQFSVAVLIWALANAIHHTFGSFLVSCGAGFRYALENSATTVFLMLFLGVGLVFVNFSPVELILAMGLLYLLRVPSVIRLSLSLLKDRELGSTNDSKFG